MKHIAFIMDGNGRWATDRNLPRAAGHQAGAQALVKAIRELNDLNVECASFYAFSTDNEKRNAEEVSNILGVIAYFLANDIKRLVTELNLQLRFIGDLKRLPQKLINIICDLNTFSLNNKGMKVILAIGYGGDVEICSAFDAIMKKRLFLKDNSPITPEELKSALYTAGIPDPDVVVRYGGHRRLSNFMPLQTAYSELYFLDKFWPDFDKEDVTKILENFDRVKRNFGGLDA
ncbi:MAG TPA: polyprenyl diphosphate synthase [Clostridia bacterium]|jgi:undecaprenyl diphosphate synthase|nr:polyprenyl diphosphate synthase [Clostridia bacterium]